MWFGILGPLLVRDGESVIGLAAGRQRVLLAALLVRAGMVVSADALAEVVWDGAPPDGAETTLRSHVMRLRRVLGQPAGARVVTRHPGYLIQAAEEEVDILRFRRLCQDGGAAARERAWARAWETLTEALGLWRGEPLADVPSEVLRRDQLPGLERLRLQAAEWRMDAGLQQGRHAELVAELQSLVAREPLRERFHGQLMLALVRCGRQAEALETYRRAREVLVRQLGTEPGTELRELHQRILTADPALAVPRSAAGTGDRLAVMTGDRPAVVVPRELPAPVAGFVGRRGELAVLTGLLDQSAGQAPAIVISAIGGTAGVGKTALAVQWAHQAADRFPDGQLHVNLRGYDPGLPMTAADALAGFLRALGVPGQDIPAGEDERAALYRSLLAGTKMLIVLDNARSVEQVRPLLPGSASCAVVVTSRDSLAGLVARHGATRLDLDLLPPAEAVGLLCELIGARARAESAAAAMIAEQCCRLPLALRVAAELAAARPDVSLAELAGELADQQQRLDLLQAGGDPRTAVRAVFAWSVRHLDADAARAFRLLGLHPGSEFDPYATAALTGTGLQQARTVLDALARAHLIRSAGPGRYGMHDLLRAYARELAAREGREEQCVPLTRLFDYYLCTASTAMDTVRPAERDRLPCFASASPAPPVAEPAAARAWLDAERASLVAVTMHAAGHGWAAHAIRLAAIMFRYLDNGGRYPDATTINSQARAVAHREGLRQSIALFREPEDRTWQAYALHNLGMIRHYQGRYREAIRLHGQALDMFRETGDLNGKAFALNSLGVNGGRQGRYDLAARHHGQALAIAAEIGDRVGECDALLGLGTVGLRQGRCRQAAGHLDRALALNREAGYWDGQAEALTRLGDVCLRRGHVQEAAGQLRQALALYREIGNRSGEADALNSLGEVLLAAGQPDDAHSECSAALRLATEIGDTYQQARAHYCLGQARSGYARVHWQQALALFTELGTPEADQVRAALSSLQNHDHREREARR
jgi:DNA-binding SARP family transcriptional activator/tetratricopeptide (TPR) repeat protein